jgi:hypothetical protein
MTKLLFYLLLSPLVWWGSASIIYALSNKKGEPYITQVRWIGLIFLLAFWATYFI